MTFFELRTPADLFRKLESDLQALEASFQDARVAFNFFVTAEHLPDWLNRRNIVRKHALLRVVSHLANGAKHFRLDDDRHSSIVSTVKSRYWAEGYAEPGYVHEPLIIHLEATEQEKLGGPVIDALTLGRKVIEFWRPFVFSMAGS